MKYCYQGLTTVLALLTAGALDVSAAPVAVVNHSFEEPGSGSEITDFGQISGWSFEDGGDSTTSINTFDGTSDGSWSCSLGPNEGFVYQLTGHAIQAGNYVLKVDAKDEGTVKLELYYGDNTLATQSFPVGEDFSTKDLNATVNVGSAAIGQPLGLRFKNTQSDSWAVVDNVRLTFISIKPNTDQPTPSPTTKATAPKTVNNDSVSMTATAASDPTGVEHFPKDSSSNQNETACPATPHGVTREPPVIVYPEGGSELELLAAKEIRRYFYLRTDQLLEVRTAKNTLPPKGDLILVANDDNPMVKSLRSLIDHTTSEGGYIIKTVKSGRRNILVITGHTSDATLCASYRYAEHLGVGFGLALDAIPDARITLDITGLDEVGEPLFPIRGIQPFHDFPEGPDFWNTDDYLVVISQLPKLGMNFIGLHTYPSFSTTEEKDQNRPQGPEPTVWIGLPQDVSVDGTVTWSYPTNYAHTKRPDRRWGFDTWDTDQFAAGAGSIFPSNGYGSDVIGESMPSTMAESNAVFNRAGAMFKKAFTHARDIGVKTAMGTEIPLGLEPAGPEVGYDWVRGMPPELQERLAGMDLDPMDPAVVKEVYKGIFERIMKTHPLDYYWLWSWEIWSAYGVSDDQIQAMKNDILLADQALAELGRPFQLGLAGWILGTGDNPAEFDRTLPPEAPFFGLWDAADGFEELSGERKKWPATWLEEDWGLVQPQLEVNRIHGDASAAWEKNCDGFIAKHWRTRILAASIWSMKDVLWAYGPTGTPLNKSIPSNKDEWIEAIYLDWAIRQFGSEAASPISAILANLDKAGESGAGSLPRILEWETELEDGDGAPGSIARNSANWASEQDRYAFVGHLEALRPQIVGAGNLERFDYWLKAMQCMRIMGKYSCIRDDFEEAAENEEWSAALSYRIAMADLWEQLMTLQVEKATNASDLGEIVNLEILNWKQLVMNKWDAPMADGLGGPLPPEANPSGDYTGSALVKVAPVRTLASDEEALTLNVLITGNPTSADLYYRPLGGSSYTSIPLKIVARNVYEVTIPAQTVDYEYYIEAQTLDGPATFPVTAPSINQTVVVMR